jgi:hypothetical protein
MGLFSFIDDIKDIYDAQEIINEGLQAALDTMESMISNEGQRSVFDSAIAPAFEDAAQASPEDGWDTVSADPYSDFMGEICEAGNQIMEESYEYAQEVLADEESYDDDEFDPETGEFFG